MMNDIFNILMEYYLEYNFIFLAVILLVAFNGVPLGANMYMVIAGAFTRLAGESYFVLLLFIWTFAVLGDLSCYLIWNKFGQILLRTKNENSRLEKGLRKARALLNKHGVYAVLLVKFPLSGLGPYLAMTAGMSNWNFRLFAVLTGIGDFVWSIFYMSIGYYFADEWEDVANFADYFSNAMVYLAIIIIAVYFLRRAHNKSKLKKQK